MMSKHACRPTIVPDVVGDYQLFHNKELGRGSNAIVYLGKNRHNEKEVALKSLVLPFQNEDEAVNSNKLIDNEIKTLKLVTHPKIVEFYGYEKHDRHMYIILELCNSNLQEFAIGHKIPDGLKLQFVHDITEAIQCLHKHKPQIIHRDIKPENLLIQQQDGMWILKLSDFGSSRLIPEGLCSILYYIQSTSNTLCLIDFQTNLM